MSWPKVSLGELCALTNGSAFKPTDWSDAGLPIIRIQNLNNRSKPFNYWSGSTDRKVIVDTGDVLLAWSGTPGTSFGAHTWDRERGVLNQHIFRVDLDEERVAKNWAVPAINAQLEVLVGQAHGGVGLRHVKRSEVEAIQIPLPPLAEQLRLANKLDSKMAALSLVSESASKRLDACESLQGALLRAAFSNITPISIGIPIEPAPSGWTWKLLGDLARLESGHTPSRKHPEWWGGDIPWIALPDIRALDGLVAEDTRDKTNEDGINNSSARMLPKDTVVFSRDVVIGFVTLLGRPMATSQHFFNWVCGEELHPRFLMHALRTARPYLETMSSGAIHQTIYKPAAMDFHIAVPDPATQTRIVAQLDEQLTAQAALRRAAESELEAIRALPAATLRQVFTDAA